MILTCLFNITKSSVTTNFQLSLTIRSAGMLSSLNEIEQLRLKKLHELNYLLTNPLQSLESFKARNVSRQALEFYNANDVKQKKPFNIPDGPSEFTEDSIIEFLKKPLDSELFQPTTPQKRPAEERHESEQLPKAQKAQTEFPSRLTSASIVKDETRKTAGLTSLTSQIENLEARTNEFLNKSIEDLEIVSVPEHYPTEVHAVSSLAELYYLTQTLPLIKLLPGSYKTLMTENFELALLEGKIAVLYSRIEELKRQNKWSLRQPLRYYDPFLYSKKNKKSKLYHWDTLLEEANWMAAEFKESLKFKKACCVTIAQGIQDFWTFGKIVCVKRKPIVHLLDKQEALEDKEPQLSIGEGENKQEVVDEIMKEVDNAPKEASADVEMKAPEEPVEETTENAPADDVKPAPEEPAEPEEAGEAEEEETPSIDVSKLLERPNPADEIPPLSVPELSAEQLKEAGYDHKNSSPFKTHVDINDLKKLDQSILRNLPKFTAFDNQQTANLQQPLLKPGETSIVPVSRMFMPMEKDDNWYKIVLKEKKESRKPKGSSGKHEYQKGLFGVQPHRKFNFLKPPKPPNVKNIEYRSPTIWLPQDDKNLIHYVAEYCFNWDLIAENLTAHSSVTMKRYESNTERRTPWQCFERYIQLNEKFQFTDMKGINAYAAQQWLEHAHKAQLTTKRRISPLGVGNESIQRGHRKLRWASMFDAMRKTMRKREQALAKANHRRNTSLNEFNSLTASAAASGGNGSIPTPAELSRLKFDRDKSIQEVQMNQEATRSKMLNAVSQQQKNSAGQALSMQALKLPQQPSLQPGLQTAQPQAARDASSAPGMAQRRVSQVPSSAQMQNFAQRTQAAGTRPNGISLQRQDPSAASSLPPQSQAGLIGNIKRPTTPNGTPYTVEQIQQLLQIQKQRRLMQQQNQNNRNPAQGTSATLGNMPDSAGQTRKPISAPQAGSYGSPQGTPATASAAMAAGTSSSPALQQASIAQAGKRPGTPAKGRLQIAPAQVSAIISSIQQRNPNLTKEQVTKLAASYLASLQQQQQNRLQQQQQQLQLHLLQLPSAQSQMSLLSLSLPAGQRAAQAGVSGPQSLQQSLGQARQAHLQRQRMAGTDSQTLSRLQYEERKKLMMRNQPSSPFVGSAASSPNMGTLSPTVGKQQISPRQNYANYPRSSTSSKTQEGSSDLS